MKVNNLTAAKSNLPNGVTFREEWAEIQQAEASQYVYLQISNMDTVVDGMREVEKLARRIFVNTTKAVSNNVLRQKLKTASYIMLHDPFKKEEAPKKTTTRKPKTEE